MDIDMTKERFIHFFNLHTRSLPLPKLGDKYMHSRLMHRLGLGENVPLYHDIYIEKLAWTCLSTWSSESSDDHDLGVLLELWRKQDASYLAERNYEKEDQETVINDMFQKFMADADQSGVFVRLSDKLNANKRRSSLEPFPASGTLQSMRLIATVVSYDNFYKEVVRSIDFFKTDLVNYTNPQLLRYLDRYNRTRRHEPQNIISIALNYNELNDHMEWKILKAKGLTDLAFDIWRSQKYEQLKAAEAAAAASAAAAPVLRPYKRSRPDEPNQGGRNNKKTRANRKHSRKSAHKHKRSAHKHR